MAHARMVRAGMLFPFDMRFQKAPAYLDFLVADKVDPDVVLGDVMRGLRTDPYAPDLVRAMLVFATRAQHPELVREARDRCLTANIAC